jgi:membrane protease subunit (stomatin/prohibitin family)
VNFVFSIPDAKKVIKQIPKKLDQQQAKDFLKQHLGAFYNVKVGRMGKYGAYVISLEHKKKERSFTSVNADLVGSVRRLIWTA